MKTLRFLFLLLSIGILASSCSKPIDYTVKKAADANGFNYDYVTNDPMASRVYTLDNGLKVYLTQNFDQPRIQTFIAVKAGSSYDPKETTGLAHYLEHIMFKGTSKIGTVNWEKEEALLNQISDLYEQHKAATDSIEKKKIYAQIDALSQQAAQYAVPSEYDKMVTTLGAQRTNAWTSYEQTVYMNDIPSNELNRWLKIESERFSSLVLRLFHTELETVYEEFNMTQDNDDWKADETLKAGLFTEHPYGTQTVIGKAEHLKNPSMVNIHNYWSTYYVPNNMAICMSGDLDFEKTIQAINETFGKFKPGNVPQFNSPVEKPIEKAREFDVIGPDAEQLIMGFRFNGINSEDRKYVSIIDQMLNNNVAGLIDIDLVQKQKVLQAGTYPEFMKYYGVHNFWGVPREGQTLEEVKDLILGEVEKIKKGEFEDWMIEASIKDLQLNQLLGLESNWRAYSFVYSFVNDVPWIEAVSFNENLKKITREQIVEFANKNYGNNYVVVYKRTGVDTTAIKVDKPQITAVPLNRDTSSVFFNEFLSMPSDTLKPVFVDFKKDIQSTELARGMELDYIKSTKPELFRLNFMVDMGSDNIRELPVAFDLLNYLGTDKLSPEDLKKEFYKNGIKYETKVDNNSAVIQIYGLQESLGKALEIMEQIITASKPDTSIYAEYVQGVLKKRADAKLDKQTILWQGMYNYGKYGKLSTFTNIISEQELIENTPEKYTELIKTIPQYKQRFAYCGQEDMGEVKSTILKYHAIPEVLKEYPAPINPEEHAYDSSKVYFVNYDMVQVMILLVAKDTVFTPSLIPDIRLFNEYFGAGLSSIVFQEIREAKGLAYTAFSVYDMPDNPMKSHYILAYLSTQADKLEEATNAMLELMNNMPEAAIQFEGSKTAVMKKIETERKVNMDLFNTYKWHLDMGIDHDIRQDVYNTMQNVTIDDLKTFFQEHINGKKYAILVLGNKSQLDMNTLSQLGNVQELTLEDIFNY